jgi:GTP-binding protein EngB required for normal cell division
VLFIGRSNVGKSSLLNALLGDKTLNRVSRTPGFTKVMHAYTLGPISASPSKASKASSKSSSNSSSSGGGPGGLLTIIDTPGYGHASALTTGHSLTTYLSRRSTLRRVFVLINPSHGVKKTDHQVFELLRSQGISYQIVATKADALEPPTRRQELLQKKLEEILDSLQRDNMLPSRTPSFSPDGLPLSSPGAVGTAGLMLGEIIATSFLGDGMRNNRTSTTLMQGISALQFAVLRAVGLDGYAVTKFLGTEEGKKLGEQEGVGLGSVITVATKTLKEDVHTAGVGDQDVEDARAHAAVPDNPAEDIPVATPSEAPGRMPQLSVARPNSLFDLEEASRKDSTAFSRRRAVAA